MDDQFQFDGSHQHSFTFFRIVVKGMDQSKLNQNGSSSSSGKKSESTIQISALDALFATRWWCLMRCRSSVRMTKSFGCNWPALKPFAARTRPDIGILIPNGFDNVRGAALIRRGEFIISRIESNSYRRRERARTSRELFFLQRWYSITAAGRMMIYSIVIKFH